VPCWRTRSAPSARTSTIAVLAGSRDMPDLDYRRLHPATGVPSNRGGATGSVGETPAW
jgi:hypothetical protein